MRLRKVKNAKEQIESSSYVISDPESHKGNFNKLFNNDNPIRIEIGMGKGTFIYNHALKNPNINYIGIEKFDSVLVRAVQKLEDTDIPNLKLIRMDALDIDKIFSKEIDTIYLNFSDPWPKNRHELRRLTSPVFLAKYDSVFKNDKVIIQKTDNRHLFEYSLVSLVNYGYKLEKISLDLYKEEELLKDNIPTEYETRFASNGDTIYMAEFRLQ
ncbi:MAG: tRNA (guanosine(46)-N7)-methyltransferase TrmB [Bacilli bacterium]|nr:tRNA (guanosine(46)-N7)-methyltransferase TrmB [Bacilli bacterium]